MTHYPFRSLAAVACGFALLATHSSDSAISQERRYTPGQVISFKACPVFRNTRVERGCWLSRHDGELFFIGHRPERGPAPTAQLMHQVLVEGVIADEPDTCGGIVIHPVAVSVIEELDESCDEILPDEGYASAPSSSAEQAAAFFAPGFGGRPQRAFPPGPSLPEPPYEPQTFSVGFDFDSTFLTGINRRPVADAADLAMASNGQVTITGYSVDSLLSDGTVEAERNNRALHRAQLLAEALETLGVPAEAITLRSHHEATPQNGAHAPAMRRATIEVIPQ